MKEQFCICQSIWDFFLINWLIPLSVIPLSSSHCNSNNKKISITLKLHVNKKQLKIDDSNQRINWQKFWLHPIFIKQNLNLIWTKNFFFWNWWGKKTTLWSVERRLAHVSDNVQSNKPCRFSTVFHFTFKG